jgi:hypothetical protein
LALPIASITEFKSTPAPVATQLPALLPTPPKNVHLPVQVPIKTIEPELPPPSNNQPGELVITSASWAEVWVDGKKLGYFRKGPSSEWVGSAQNPIILSPGEHRLVVVNDKSEPFEQTITIAPGARQTLKIQLSRKPVTFLVNQQLPRSCSLTVGTTHYRSIQEINGIFKLIDPAPTTPVVFDCPDPFGHFTTMLGPTEGGESIVIPATLATASP